MKSNQTASVETTQVVDAIQAKTSGKVNMKNLISRYKKQKAKEKTETFIFVGLACALVVVSGIIISL